MASTTLNLDTASLRTCLVGGGLVCHKKFGFDGDRGVVGRLNLLSTLLKVSSALSESLASL